MAFRSSSLVALLLSSSALVNARFPGFVRNPLSTRQEKNETAVAPPDVAAAWYASWHAENYTVDQVPWSKYTHMTYAFAETMENGGLNITDPEVLPKFVAAAQNHSVKALISVGGWTGSRFFSTSVGDAANRTAFVEEIVGVVDKYGLDGVDFDWEYPNKQGLGCNLLHPNDTQHYLEFLQELRAHPTGANLIITAATSIFPFNNATDQPSDDVSAFAQIYDYLALMNYDLWGGWSSAVGPNAALNETCAAPENQQGSAVRAVQSWVDAGFPIEKLVLGVPSYGRSSTVYTSNAYVEGNSTELAPYPAFNGTDKPTGDEWDGPEALNACGVLEGPGGIFQFWGMMDNGFLTYEGEVADGIGYRYDNCSQTPYVYNATTEVMISYDNAQSYAAKGEFIKTLGLKGFAMWEVAGDYDDILVDSIRAASGMPEEVWCEEEDDF